MSKNIENMKNLETVVFEGILTQKWLRTAAIHFSAETEFDFKIIEKIIEQIFSK